MHAWYGYDTISAVDNHSLTPTLLAMGILSAWIHTSIIDAIHRGRGQQVYDYLPWRSIFKKTCVFLLVVLLTISMIVLGTLCLIIPGIILSVHLAFSPYLAIIDDCGIGQSIRNSFAISQKNWWFLSNRLSLVALILCILILGVLLLTLGVWFFFRDESVMHVEQQIKAVTIPVIWFLNAFIYPLMHALILETLYDLRLRKEHSGV